MQPFGPWRDNLHAAMITSAIANSNRGRDSPAINPDEFFYRDAIAMDEWKKQKALQMFESVAKLVGDKSHGEQ